jgi:hypothetical protein
VSLGPVADDSGCFERCDLGSREPQNFGEDVERILTKVWRGLANCEWDARKEYGMPL